MESKKTLRMIYPQWQGGVNPDYHFGSRLLAYIAPPSKTDETVEISVSTDFEEKLVKMDGIDGGMALLGQMEEAAHILEEKKPDRVIVFGGECSVSQKPFDYLHGKYGDGLGILWLDAHPDVSGIDDSSHLHEMVLGNLLGESPESEITRVKYSFLPQKVMFVGLIEKDLRQMDQAAKRLCIRIAGPEDIAINSQPILDWIVENDINRIAVHWDLDVLSRDDFRSNTCAKPHMSQEEYGAAMGKLTLTQTVRILNDISSCAEIVGLAIAEHMPWDALNLRKAFAEIPIFND